MKKINTSRKWWLFGTKSDIFTQPKVCIWHQNKITNMSKRFVYHASKLGSWRFGYVKIDQLLLLEPSIHKQRKLSYAPNNWNVLFVLVVYVPSFGSTFSLIYNCTYNDNKKTHSRLLKHDCCNFLSFFLLYLYRNKFLYSFYFVNLVI